MDFEIREDRTRNGRRLTREREAYFQLMRQGCSSAEACRVVGINLRTGKRWRNGWHSPPDGRKPVLPIHVAAPASGQSRYLREEARIHIADRLRENASIRTIAAELGRSPSTINREIRRNGMPLRGTSLTGPTAPIPRIAAPNSGVPDRSRGRSPRTRSCGTSSRTTWTVLSR
ncbi:helix-turn-helix domain-containing protein [Kitasatospora sp. NPDC086801]|uniref:helix-turn-helix domain-containing protein n=1 Tax=Kitasatospora sp. NPDC086801 TaxID=3364066 RepID=UPI0037F112A8